MIVILKHHKTLEERTIECISWDFSKKGNVYEFFQNKDNRIYVAAYSVYNWDLKEIDYETT